MGVAVARAFQTWNQSGGRVSSITADWNAFIDGFGAFRPSERSGWTALARSLTILVLVEATRAQSASLGSSNGRCSSRTVEASWDVGSGGHVQHFARSASKSARNGRVEGLERRTGCSGFDLQQRLQDFTGRNGQIKDQSERRSAQIVKLRLADGRRHQNDVRHLHDVVFNQQSLGVAEGDVHVDADGGTAAG